MADGKILLMDNWSTSYDNPYAAPEAQRVCLHGAIIGSSRFSEDRNVLTSPIDKVTKDEDSWVVTTTSGSRYRLGSVDPNWLKWMEREGIEFNPDEPIRDRRIGRKG